MQRDNQPWQAMPAPRLQWSDAGVPGSSDFGDIYFSREDGLAESRYVFLEGNGLPGRWASHARDEFVIAETGFGTGLNFLLTWQAWAGQPRTRPRLHYLAVEQYPLRRTDLERALAAWPALSPFATELLEQYPPPVPGCHRLCLAGGAITLDLWWAEAEDALAELDAHGRRWVDAWYLDGFAPARNAAMWSEPLLQRVGALSRAGATVATFTAAGAVRRALQVAGFSMRKGPGFGRKRERLLGSHGTTTAVADATTADAARGANRPLPTGTPWDIPAHTAPAPRSALVIGAGLAGCATAAALARRGIRVSLLEAGAVAEAASGNAQGVLYTRLSRRHSALSDFALLSFAHASRRYRALLADGQLRPGHDGELCGCFHQQDDGEELAILAERLAQVPELASVLDAAAANARLGITQHSAGYWFPDSGWLSPPALCRAWAAAQGVTLREHCGPLQLRRREECWQAVTAAGECLAQADCAVIACGGASGGLTGLDWLPLQPIRGQTTHLPAGPPFDQLRAALCHEGYIAPASGEHCIGATFNLGENTAQLRPGDHRHNLDKLAAAVPAWADALAACNPDTLAGRVGFRCTTPDYLPLAGPVPDTPALLATFAGLRQNARKAIASPGHYMPGLFLNTGHGSRGLSSAPLCAELIASQACGEAPPLPRYLSRALAPARFLIRDLGRKRR